MNKIHLIDIYKFIYTVNLITAPEKISEHFEINLKAKIYNGAGGFINYDDI